jgi:monoamine oxidase
MQSITHKINQPMQTTPDVLIIGAGASGLAAAKHLTKLGLTYTLLEGSHRIGGRAYSEAIAPGVWFDLGCSYLHHIENNPFVAIADTLNMTLGKDKRELFQEHKRHLYKNGQPLNQHERQAYYNYHAACYAAIHRAAKQKRDVAILDLIDLDHVYAPSFIHYMSDINALDIDQTSAVDFDVFDDGLDFPILEGYGNLVAAWGADVPVSLNTQVHEINWKNKHVCVKTSKGDMHASTALITVSTGVLAASDILFTPNLPDWKLEAILGLPNGTENKIGVLFDCDVFGPDARGLVYAWHDNGDAIAFEVDVMGQNLATVSCTGRQGVWLEKQGPKACHDYALDCLTEVFGQAIRKHVIRSISTAWATDPWTKGAYSCALPGHAHQREKLAENLNNKLFFAGEATALTDYATCHGAYYAGIRAAEEITNHFLMPPT